jgi:hypothetical protein
MQDADPDTFSPITEMPLITHMMHAAGTGVKNGPTTFPAFSIVLISGYEGFIT